MEIWVARGDLVQPFTHALGPKSFYPGRDKSGLEGITQTLPMIGASEGAQPSVAGRVRNLTFHFEK
jgi:hypothetical protein